MLCHMLQVHVHTSPWINDFITVPFFSLFDISRATEGESISSAWECSAQKTRSCQETSPPGQRSQIHVHLSAPTHILFSLSRLHLVSEVSSSIKQCSTIYTIQHFSSLITDCITIVIECTFGPRKLIFQWLLDEFYFWYDLQWLDK